jgi:hypothetical protein
METINRNAVYEIAGDVRIREETFGLLVVSKRTPAVSLNMDSKSVWDLLDGKRTVDDVIQIILEEYEEKTVEKNIMALLAQLLELGLIRLVC